MQLGKLILLAISAPFIITVAASAQDQHLRPFWGSSSGVVTFGISDTCTTQQQVQTITNAKGNLTHLGLTTMTMTHCPSDDGSLALNGHATFTAANGDTILGTYTAHVTTPPPPLIVEEGELMIAGGTGRFEHATGRVVITVYVNPVSPPTFDAKWPIDIVFAGTIAY